MPERKDCRITRIDTYVVGARWCNWIFAHVHTDDGISGVGEGTTFTVYLPMRPAPPSARSAAGLVAKVS